jgi:hypothetical protein
MTAMTAMTAMTRRGKEAPLSAVRPLPAFGSCLITASHLITPDYEAVRLSRARRTRTPGPPRLSLTDAGGHRVEELGGARA